MRSRQRLWAALVLVAVLRAPSTVKAQQKQPAEDPFWSHRHAVLLAVKWGKDLRFETASVVTDHARPALAESLLAATRTWSLPDWLRPLPGGSAGSAYTVCVAHVTDRTESSNPAAMRLSEDMRVFLSRGHFAEWMQELSRGDSLATWADFVVSGVRSI